MMKRTEAHIIATLFAQFDIMANDVKDTNLGAYVGDVLFVFHTT
jgi:hypothetical protein